MTASPNADHPPPSGCTAAIDASYCSLVPPANLWTTPYAMRFPPIPISPTRERLPRRSPGGYPADFTPSPSIMSSHDHGLAPGLPGSRPSRAAGSGRRHRSAPAGYVNARQHRQLLSRAVTLVLRAPSKRLLSPRLGHKPPGHHSHALSSHIRSRDEVRQQPNVCSGRSWEECEHSVRSVSCLTIAMPARQRLVPSAERDRSSVTSAQVSAVHERPPGAELLRS